MKFVVSFINFFDNELKSSIIEADSKLESMLKYLEEKEGIKLELKLEDEEEIKQSCFDMDSMINSIEI